MIGGLSSLHDRLSRLAGVLSRLYPVNLLAKIQVAKEPRFEQNGGVIADLTKFVASANEHIGDSLSDVTSGLGRIQEELGRLSADAGAEGSRSAVHLEDIGRAGSRLAVGGRTLLGRIRDFSVFSGQFQALFRQAEDDVQSLTLLVEELDSLIGELGEHGPASGHGDFHGMTDGTDDRSLESVADRFTILKHKDMAASLTGGENKEGSQEGELILF